MDLDKLKTIDDLRNLGITYTPASQKDYTVQELFEIRDLIQSMIDKIPEDQRQVSPWYYGLSPKSGPTDFDKLVNLRGDLINALEDRRRNTAFWSKDDSIDPYGPNPFAEKRSDDNKLPEKEHFGEQQDSDYPDPSDVGGLIYNSTAKKRNALMRDWLEHNFRNDGFSLPKSLFNRIHDSVNNLTGVNKDPEDEAAFINALNKEFKNDFVSDDDDDEEHFGEEQAEGLDNLLEGLRDTPHDNRW